MALRLLLDQMLDSDVALSLRAAGHDVIQVSELGLATAPDSAVLDHAVQHGRVLVTLDEHFGDWAVLPLSHHAGVVRVKADPATTSNALAVLLPFLNGCSNRNFQNRLVIVRANGARWITTGSAE